ncbi:MAG: LysR family transcriptional regulator [Limimaricola sp.]|uniref:LysR family transcriptional regulator n=1 Tax=Limimaricola sp. TaxID=2211665 RepID=UPI001E099FA4|nr:LysR family transcriptional regulator [Limimaricola sp.]MBI1417874.1 LysR family transcriptional regulator [Limimaricola sp.]
MEDTDWHIFLAVARQGSTLAASHSMHVSQSTVSRRITALEKALGLQLFDRSPAGYVLTPVGTEMVVRAEAIERAIAEALVSARQQRRDLAGRIRFTTFVTSGQSFIAAAVRDFRRAFPDITVEIVATEGRQELLKGEADVAMRVGAAPTETGLVIRRLLTDSWAVYCSADYAAAHGVPRTPEEFAQHSVLTVSDAFKDLPIVRWVEEVVPDSNIVMRHHDAPGLLSGLKEGIGVGLASDMMAEAAGMIRCFTPPVAFEAPIWLITTEKLRHEPRIRAFLDFLAGYVTQKKYRKADAGTQ